MLTQLTSAPKSWLTLALVPCVGVLTRAHMIGQGMFDLKGKFPDMPANVRLWKGLFSDSLPGFVAEMDKADPSGRAPPIKYLHVDCDLYVGASRSGSCLRTYFWTLEFAKDTCGTVMQLVGYVLSRLHVRKCQGTGWGRRECRKDSEI